MTKLRLGNPACGKVKVQSEQLIRTQNVVVSSQRIPWDVFAAVCLRIIISTGNFVCFNIKTKSLEVCGLQVRLDPAA